MSRKNKKKKYIFKIVWNMFIKVNKTCEQNETKNVEISAI